MIKNVRIEKWCIACRNCENICPKIFKVNWTSQVISDKFTENQNKILEAEIFCPVNVIKTEIEWNLKIEIQQAKLISKSYIAANVLELNFQTKEKIQYKAWQYLAFLFEDMFWKFSRSYSISKIDWNKISITVKILEKWRWSKILTKLKTWNTVQFLWWLGDFTIKNENKKKYFLATWTWLAPMLPMLKSLPQNEPKTLIVWNKYESEIYYQQELSKIKNLKIEYYISQEKDTKYNFWRITNFLGKIEENSQVYICGNPQMVKSVKESLNWKNIEIISEDFTESPAMWNIFKEIFVNWNIVFLKQISWFFILIWIFLYPILYIFRQINGIDIFEDFLFFGSFQGFFWSISRRAVVFVMFIRPLSDIFDNSSFLRKCKEFRKPLWILSASIIVFSLIIPFFFNFDNLLQYFEISRWQDLTWLTARISEITAIVLLVTSNSFSQKKLWKNWKKIQYSSYAYFVCWGIMAAEYEPLKYYLPIFIWILLILTIFIKKRFFIK